MKQVKNNFIILAIFLTTFLSIGCAATKPADQMEPIIIETDMDRLMETVMLTSAVDLGDGLIREDPNKWERVLSILLEKAVSNPRVQYKKK